jgi:hypothetical protein
MWRPATRCLDPTHLRSGRCGDWVWYVLGGKQRRRRDVIPRDPRTPAQLRSRAALGATSRDYSAVLTEAQQDACIAAGAKVQSRRRLGSSGPLTGQQYHVRQECAGKQYREAAAQVAQSQRVTQAPWEPHAYAPRVTPYPLACRTGALPLLRASNQRVFARNCRIGRFGPRGSHRPAALNRARGPPGDRIGAPGRCWDRSAACDRGGNSQVVRTGFGGRTLSGYSIPSNSTSKTRVLLGGILGLGLFGP